jgi:hypothetical protein
MHHMQYQQLLRVSRRIPGLRMPGPDFVRPLALGVRLVYRSSPKAFLRGDKVGVTWLREFQGDSKNSERDRMDGLIQP